MLQWIDRALVREAKVLLHHTAMPVAEVAEKLGFATPSFFIRFFRQQTGHTPLQYRKQGYGRCIALLVDRAENITLIAV